MEEQIAEHHRDLKIWSAFVRGAAEGGLQSAGLADVAAFRGAFERLRLPRPALWVVEADEGRLHRVHGNGSDEQRASDAEKEI